MTNIEKYLIDHGYSGDPVENENGSVTIWYDKSDRFADPEVEITKYATGTCEWVIIPCIMQLFADGAPNIKEDAENIIKRVQNAASLALELQAITDPWGEAK